MKKISVTVDDSTYRWLLELANANGVNIGEIEATPAGLLAQAAFCFADYAGRRPGSWEADVGGSLLNSSGVHATIGWEAFDRCLKVDQAYQAKLRENWQRTHPEEASP